MRFSSHCPRTWIRSCRSAGSACPPARTPRRPPAPAAAHLAAHQVARLADDPLEVLVADVGERPPGVDPARVEALVLPEVPDAGERALVQQRVGDRPRRVVGAQAGEDRLPVELRGEDVGAQPPQVGVEAQRVSRISSRIGPLNWTMEWPAVSITSHAARDRRPWSKPCSKTRQRPDIRRWEWTVRSLSKRRKRCFPWVSMLPHAGAGELLGPASSAWRRWGVRIRSSGSSTRTGRSRPAIDRIVSPSGIRPM